MPKQDCIAVAPLPNIMEEKQQTIGVKIVNKSIFVIKLYYLQIITVDLVTYGYDFINTVV